METDALAREWRYYLDIVQCIPHGDAAALREASTTLGYPLASAVPGCVSAIDELGQQLVAERDATASLSERLRLTDRVVTRLTAQLAAAQGEVTRLTAEVVTAGLTAEVHLPLQRKRKKGGRVAPLRDQSDAVLLAE